jgi:hypothetical protein
MPYCRDSHGLTGKWTVTVRCVVSRLALDTHRPWPLVQTMFWHMVHLITAALHHDAASYLPRQG